MAVILRFRSAVPRHHREGRRVQPHDLQEPGLQGGLLLGVSGTLGTSRILLVQLQQVSSSRAHLGWTVLTYLLLQIRRGRGEKQSDQPGAESILAAEIFVLL